MNLENRGSPQGSPRLTCEISSTCGTAVNLVNLSEGPARTRESLSIRASHDRARAGDLGQGPEGSRGSRAWRECFPGKQLSAVNLGVNLARRGSRPVLI